MNDPFLITGPRGALLCACAVLCSSTLMQAAWAQETEPEPVKTEPAASDPAAEKPFSEGELEQLTAPIALYPDSLVSQILMASTYPLEVVQAYRWASGHESLQGDDLTAALEKESWDPSVKSLVNFPQVLEQMNQKLDWTQKLGDAVLAQQADVMAAVQRLRAKAKEAGHLETTPEQQVVAEGEIIRIEPVRTEVIYVPTYDPLVVYGMWGYPAYPPRYYYPPGYVYARPGYGFGAGIVIGAAWGYAWGGCRWGRNEIDIDINRNININKNINRNKYKANAKIGAGNGTWKHNAEHRKGVRYRDNKTIQQYKGKSKASSSKARDAYRGRSNTSHGKLPNKAAARNAIDSSSRTGIGSRSRSSIGSARRSGSGSVFSSHGGGSAVRQHASRGRSSRGRSGGGRLSGLRRRH